MVHLVLREPVLLGAQLLQHPYVKLSRRESPRMRFSQGWAARAKVTSPPAKKASSVGIVGAWEPELYGCMRGLVYSPAHNGGSTERAASRVVREICGVTSSQRHSYSK